MNTVTATKVLDKFVGAEKAPQVYTLTRPVAGTPKTVKVNGKNATELADVLGDIKRQIKELEENEKLHADAFKTYARERQVAALKKDPKSKPIRDLLITGVLYKVDIKIDLESDRFQTKLFCEENPGVAKLYTQTITYDKVDVRNVK